jgi:rRNA-processing protein FCF1
MLCGKHKIFDVTKLFIYYKNNLLVPSDDTQKLKEIFKSKKVKLEISNTPIKKQKPEKTESFKYYCKCKNGASYICDKCEEFLCDFCLKKKSI